MSVNDCYTQLMYDLKLKSLRKNSTFFELSMFKKNMQYEVTDKFSVNLIVATNEHFISAFFFLQEHWQRPETLW